MGALTSYRKSNVDKQHLNQTTKRKKQRRSKTKEKPLNFTIYIRRLNRVINPKMSLAISTINIFNDFLNDLFQRACEESKILCNVAKRKTLSAADIKSAFQMVLSQGNLMKVGNLEAQKSLLLLTFAKFNSLSIECLDEIKKKI